ncbi:hypothetical protein AGMMS49990_04740 [Endomicrobiia bacterium]|nr:hypothetical protein AGMMS49990_04740 [Endomicrobiia bacterium]
MDLSLFVIFIVGWVVFATVVLVLVMKSCVAAKLKLFVAGWVVLITVPVMLVAKDYSVLMELKLFIIGCILFVTAMMLLVIKKYFKTQKSQENFKNAYSWVDTLWTALVMASFIMFFFVQTFKIPSGSMRNTILEGDHLFVNKFIYGFKVPFASNGKRYMALRNIKRGDIVIFRAPPEALSSSEREQGITKDFIKRCVAVAGDKVEIIDKKLYINGINGKEPYAFFKDKDIAPKNFDLIANSDEDYQKSWEKGEFVKYQNQRTVRDNFGPVIVPDGHYMMMGDNRDYSFDSRFWGPLPDKYVKGKSLFRYWPIKRWRLI